MSAKLLLLQNFLDSTDDLVVARREVWSVRELPNGISLTMLGTPQPHEDKYYHARGTPRDINLLWRFFIFFLSSCSAAQCMPRINAVHVSINSNSKGPTTTEPKFFGTVNFHEVMRTHFLWS